MVDNKKWVSRKDVLDYYVIGQLTSEMTALDTATFYGCSKVGIWKLLWQIVGSIAINAYIPLIIYNMDQTISLMSKSLACFRERLLVGLVANKEKIEDNLENSLMLVTSLSPHIGYDKASQIAKYAYENKLTLREANRELGFVSEEDFDKYVNPENMV